MAITRAQFNAARKRGAAAVARGPVARAARYDARRALIVISQLDADLYIPTLIEGAFGSRRWMQQIGELSGSARVRLKPASRENGKRVVGRS